MFQNYGWTIIVFTVLARVLMFPLSLKQQKSTARMSAYQPMIQEIQKKWANDKNRQNQEVQKFYEENNIKMSAGCAPMLVNMLVIFGMIAVIQAPLTYILQVPEAQVDNGMAIVQSIDPESNITDSSNSYTRQSTLIGQVKENPELFIEGVQATDADGKSYLAKMDEANVEAIKGFNFNFAGLNLANAPRMKMDRYLIMPILSLLTMLGSQLIVMRTTPTTQGRGQMWMMTILMGVMFGFYAFRVPVGFSLYYTVSNIMMTVQQLVLKRIYNPETIRQEVEAEIEERRAAKKAKKKVVVRDTSGEVVSMDVSEAELAKMRLEKARALDAKKYSGEAEEIAENEKEIEAQEKARQLDEEKYGSSSGGAAKSAGEESSDDEKDADAADAETDAGADDQTQDYKPGRRKRAKMNKEEKSFAEDEQQQEENSKTEEES